VFHTILSSEQNLTSLQAIVRQFRATTKFFTGIIQCVEEHFALEKQKGHAMNLQKVVDRTAAACQVSRTTVIKVRKCDDIENCRIEDGHSDKSAHVPDVPVEYVCPPNDARLLHDEEGDPTVDHLQEVLLCVTRTRVPYIASITLVHRNIVNSNALSCYSHSSLSKHSGQTSLTA
jgi:hypothetical protein